MNVRFYISICSFGLIVLACNTNKKTISNDKLNELTIRYETADLSSKKELKKEIYQSSNTLSNDIIHTKLEVTFDWKACRMFGKATILIKPYFYPTNKLYLNARGMDILKLEVLEQTSISENSKNQINSNGALVAIKSANYEYNNDSLKINLGKTFNSKDNYVVVIEYVAKPNELKTKGSAAISDDKGLYFINPTGENPYKMPQIWTQGETQSNSVWFPTIDSPNEKMTQEILMTVDDKYITLSNGSLIESTKNKMGQRTDHWKLDLPHSPYLAMMAVGEFKKVIDDTWNGKEISYYVEKEYESQAKSIFGDTKEMIEFYSNKLGVPYPWSKYSQIVARDYVSGAMENTSATLHGDFMVYQTDREMIDDKKGNSVIAHELFHQWFGDLVTAESWSNLALNESFATYGEYLWDEYKFGRDAADFHSWQSRQGYLFSKKEVNLIRFYYNDKEDMFDAISYNKGGQILHMLRKVVGDSAFFASLKNYLETNKHKSAEIHHLRLAFEETCGQDLNWFFNQWFLNSGRPKLNVFKTFNEKLGEVKLEIEQIQDISKMPIYKLPLEIDIYTDDNVIRHHVIIEEQKQQFIFKTKSLPLLINIDAERQLLADINYEKSQTENIYQFNHAPLFIDRLEALNNLELNMASDSVYEIFKTAAQKDKFYAIRDYAITKLEKCNESKNEEVKKILLEIFKLDDKTNTRAEALKIFNKKFFKSGEFYSVNEKALTEKSYAICSVAIEALSKANPEIAMEKVKAFENENGKSLLYSIAELYSDYGSDEQFTFFHQALKYFDGFELLSFCTSYMKTIKRFNNPINVINAVKDLEIIVRTNNNYLRYGALKCIKDIINVWQLKVTNEKNNLAIALKENRAIEEAKDRLKKTLQLQETISSIYKELK